MTFNGLKGEINLTGPDKVKTNPKSIKAIILDVDVESISGGDIVKKTNFSSSLGYAGQVPFKVYFKKEGDSTADKTYVDVNWSKNSPLKSDGAKLQREIFIYVIAVDGQAVEPFIAQMSVHGLTLMQFGKSEGKDARLNALTIDTFVSVKHKFGTALIPDFKIAPLDQKVPALMALYSKAFAIYNDVMDPFIQQILGQGSSSEASNREADVDDFVDDMPEDGFTELKEEPVEKPKEDLPF